MFECLKKSEIKKAEAAANKFFGRKDCKVTGYHAAPAGEFIGFYDVQCEICFDYQERAPHDVMLFVCVADRRRTAAFVMPGGTD